MNLLDVNVVLARYRADHAHHLAARRWWDDAAGRGESFTVPDVVWIGFCRLVTSPRLFPAPATFEQATLFMQAVEEQSTYLRFSSDSRVLAQFRRLGVSSRAGSRLTTDVYLAACAMTLGATMVTFDRDFRRFDGLRIHEPA